MDIRKYAQKVRKLNLVFIYQLALYFISFLFSHGDVRYIVKNSRSATPIPVAAAEGPHLGVRRRERGRKGLEQGCPHFFDLRSTFNPFRPNHFNHYFYALTIEKYTSSPQCELVDLFLKKKSVQAFGYFDPIL